MRDKVIGMVVSRALQVLYRSLYPVVRFWWRLRGPLTLRARMVVVEGDYVLLVRSHHHGQFWSLPGGGVKRRERFIDAARREVLEEAGCAIEVDHLLGIYDSFSEGKSEHVAVFVGHPNGPLVRHLGLEIAEVRFFPLADLPPLVDPGMRQRLAEHRAGQSGLCGVW